MNLRKPLFMSLGVLVGGFLLFLLFAMYVDYSDGDRAGNIVKLSHKGVLFKTWEGELNMGALVDGNGGTWHFSVTDKKVVADVEDAMKHGYRVSLTYEEKFIRLFWRGDTKYFVTKVEVVK
jgi:hypothetical protein